ncbi:hypothetical protein FOZ63_025543, partial [Perkinsus olseni]
ASPSMILKPELSVAFGFLSLLVGSCREKLVRMTISPQKTTASATSAELMADLKVDGQDVTVQVDTGSLYTFFVEKQWYERTRPGGCAELKFKCYDCDPSSCHEGPTKTHEFSGGSQVTVFQHSGTVDFGTASADGIDFGLVVGCNESPFAALGLSPPSAKSKPGLAWQADPSGELILGGEDKSKYGGPLKYVRVVNKEEQSIMVTDLGIGDASKNRIKVSQAGYFDTGTNVIEMPDKFKTPVLQFLRIAGKKPVTSKEACESSDSGYVRPTPQDTRTTSTGRVRYLDRSDLIAPVLQFGGNIDLAVLSNSVDCRAGVTSLSLLIALYTLPPPELPQAAESLMKGLEGAGALLETEWPLLSLLSTVHTIVLQDRTESDCPFEGPISAAIERMTEVGAVLPIPYIMRHLVSLESRRDCRILRATLTVHYHRAERLLETSLLEDIFRYSHIRAEDQEAFIEDALGPSWNASGAVDHVPQRQSAQSIITEVVTHNFTVTLASRAPLLEALDLLTLHPRVTIEARSPSTEEPVHYTQMVFPHRAGSDGLISNRVRADRLPYCTRPFIDLFVAMKLTSVIEIGPHLGDCVLWAVAVTGAIGMAAEPLKQLAEMIRASRDSNGFNYSSLTVFEVAVSDKDGPVVGGVEEPIEYIWGRAVVKTIDSLVESSEAWRQMLHEGRAAGALKIHTNGGRMPYNCCEITLNARRCN